MVRAAAKNHPSVAVVTSPSRYADVLAAVAAGGFDLDDPQAPRRCGVRAHRRVRRRRRLVVRVDATRPPTTEPFPQFLGVDLRARRRAALRREPAPGRRALHDASTRPGLAQAEQLHGKPMSYNNYVDADAARRAAYDHAEPAVVAIIKHANPCGIAVGADIADAHRKAHACDPVSAFGGVIADEPTGHQRDGRAGRRDLHRGRRRTRLRAGGRRDPQPQEDDPPARAPPRCTAAAHRAPSDQRRPAAAAARRRRRRGDDPATWTLATGEAADAATLADLAFAWRACRSVKSNAILLANDGATVGVGMGQVNRVDSAKLAVDRAGERAAGSVAASDAFFPFPDGLEVLIEAGVRAVVQPGGSVRDELVVEAAQKAGVTMYFTGTRHFFH